MQTLHLIQGHITAVVWPEARRGVAILPGDFHPGYSEDNYSDWLNMQSDLERYDLTITSAAFEAVDVAGCEVLEIRPLVLE